MKSAIWLLFAFTVLALLAWSVNIETVANALEYDAKNPMRLKSGWHPNPSVTSTGIQLFGVFAAAGAIGAAIGQFTKHQLAWTIACLLTLPLVGLFVSSAMR
jgi:hypothetical protein